MDVDRWITDGEASRRLPFDNRSIGCVTPATNCHPRCGTNAPELRRRDTFATPSGLQEPFIVTASAVVVEVGAPTSHAMIVSREFGIPCVTAVVGICDRITDGALIQVDGNAGTVTVLEP